MSRRRDLERHHQSLAEMREIINSMKSLAYMETRKLSRFLPAQRSVVKSIEQMATDFLSFHPEIPREESASVPMYLLIGTERGFCGNLNQALIEKLATISKAHADVQPRLLAIGHKLHGLLEDDRRVVARIEGASVAEEVDSVLQHLVHELASHQSTGVSLTLTAIYPTEDGTREKRLLPPFQDQLGSAPNHSDPPLLNLPVEQLMLDLTDHYLFAILHQLFYASLLLENRRRMVHLEGAVRFLDDKSSELNRKCNALRQEEIIEEIEVILLSTSGLADQTL